MNDSIVFLDTETTGLARYDQVWELAYCRREPDGTETADSWFVKHNRQLAAQLPSKFYIDYMERYDANKAISQGEMATRLQTSVFHGKPHLVGSGPAFDARMMITAISAECGGSAPEPWHYHLQNIEDIVKGYLMAKAQFDVTLTARRKDLLWATATKLPQTSEALSEALGVNPSEHARHNAAGDVGWVKAQWDLCHMAVASLAPAGEYSGNIGQTITDRKGPSFPRNPGRPVKDNPQA